MIVNSQFLVGSKGEMHIVFLLILVSIEFSKEWLNTLTMLRLIDAWFSLPSSFSVCSGFSQHAKAIYSEVCYRKKLSTASLGAVIFCFHLNVKEFESANL